MATFSLENYRPYRLVLGKAGPHRFGGSPAHDGAIPRGTNVAIHHFLSLDLSDANCPIRTESAIRYLPLYYPLKYGVGGPEVQYAVRSDKEIRILYLSDKKPDERGMQYVRVSSLPKSTAKLVPLTYDEARILGFMDADAYFKPSTDDTIILRRLYGGDRFSMGGGLIRIGGLQPAVRHAQGVICRNKKCEFFGRHVHFEVVASIPPVPVNGLDSFWHEFQGADMQFCFGLCYYCGTVIAFNRAG